MKASVADSNRGTPKVYVSARRHSRLVTVLKFALPAAAIAVIAGFALSTSASGIFQAAGLAVDGVDLSSGELTMEAPVLKGFDRQNRPYDVTASSAKQDLAAPEVVILDSIDATVPVGSDFAEIDATAGVYDSKRETLELTERIEVRGLNGVEMDLTQASVDMKSGTMESNEPVSVRSGLSSISADTMAVEGNGKTIIFRERVKMIIDRSAQPGRATGAEPSVVTDASEKAGEPDSGTN